jgi:PAS domain S-box-containing protein
MKSPNPINPDIRDRVPEALAGAQIPYSVFMGALENSGFGLTQADSATNRYTYANAAFCRMIGYSLDEIVRGKLSFADLIHPDDAARCVGELRRLIRGEIDSYTVESRYVHKDGSLIPARAIIAAVQRDGTNQAVLTMGMIIPLQLWSAEATSRIHGLSFWSLSRNDQGRFCSESFRLLIGLAPDAPHLSLDEFIAHVHPEDRKAVTEDIGRAIKGSLQSSEYRIVRPSGEVRWVSQSLKPIFDVSSEVVGLVATCLDFTEVIRTPDTSPAAFTIRIVKRHVDLHWDEPLSITNLAQVANVNVRTLFKHFKLACEFTPQEYIKRVRLNHSRALLQMADRSTTVLGIALKCCFQNQGHFARDYRLAFGERPSDTLARARRVDAQERPASGTAIG